MLAAVLLLFFPAFVSVKLHFLAVEQHEIITEETNIAL